MNRRVSIYNIIVLCILFIVIVFPFFPLIIYSFAHRWDWSHLLPNEWWLDIRDSTLRAQAWDYVLSPYSHVFRAIYNTVLIAVMTTGISLLLCLPAARVLAKYKFRGKVFIEFIISMPLIFPEIIIAGGILLFFIRLKIAGMLIGIVIAHLVPCIPYMLRMLTAIYQGYDVCCEEQARMLGASNWRVFFRITVPIILPGIVAGCLFTFLVSSNLFLLTFFLGQGAVEVLPTILFSIIGSGNMNSIVAGITIIATVPGIVFLFLTERHIRKAMSLA